MTSGDQPRPAAGAASRGYVNYEQVAALYRRGRSLPPEVLDRWGATVRRYLPPGTSWVVDVGAGTGVFAEVWPRWVPARVVAVEPAVAMVSVASRTDPSVGFVRSVAENLPLRDGMVDVAWVSTALHHFVDPGRAVTEFFRVLRRGGRVLVRTYVPGRTEISYAEKFPGRSRWVRRFLDQPQLLALFVGRGFQLVDVADVLEWTETYAASAEWVSMMRHADSMLTALTDEQIAAGLQALRSEPDCVGRLELTLLVFERT